MISTDENLKQEKIKKQRRKDIYLYIFLIFPIFSNYIIYLFKSHKYLKEKKKRTLD